MRKLLQEARVNADLVKHRADVQQNNELLCTYNGMMEVIEYLEENKDKWEK